MKKYKIKKYYLTKYKKGFVKIRAVIFKYRFGFLIDIIDQELDVNYKCRHQETNGFFYIQLPSTKKEAKTILRMLNKSI